MEKSDGEDSDSESGGSVVVRVLEGEEGGAQGGRERPRCVAYEEGRMSSDNVQCL